MDRSGAARAIGAARTEAELRYSRQRVTCTGASPPDEDERRAASKEKEMDNYDDTQNGEMDPIAIARRALKRAFGTWRTAETAALRAPVGTALRQELRQAMDQAFDRLCIAEDVYFDTLNAPRAMTEQTRPRKENRG